MAHWRVARTVSTGTRHRWSGVLAVVAGLALVFGGWPGWAAAAGYQRITVGAMPTLTVDGPTQVLQVFGTNSGIGVEVEQMTPAVCLVSTESAGFRTAVSLTPRSRGLCQLMLQQPAGPGYDKADPVKVTIQVTDEWSLAPVSEGGLSRYVRGTTASVVSSPLTVGAGGNLLVASIRTYDARPSPQAVTGLTGGGLQWVQAAVVAGWGGNRLEVWQAWSDTPVEQLVVTASLEREAVRSIIEVSALRFPDQEGPGGSAIPARLP